MRTVEDSLRSLKLDPGTNSPIERAIGHFATALDILAGELNEKTGDVVAARVESGGLRARDASDSAEVAAMMIVISDMFSKVVPKLFSLRRKGIVR